MTTVTALNHINLRAPDALLATLRDFYCEVVGLREGPRPAFGSRGWWLYAAPGRTRNLISLGLWLFFLENVLFPNQHQEYGVLSLRDYLAGHTTAEPSLLDFAASQGQTPTQFMLPVPSWVHPTWLVCAGLLTLVVARRVVGLRWTATTLAAVYLGYRAMQGIEWIFGH